jgi:undecaprenyl-diphosphatase
MARSPGQNLPPLAEHPLRPLDPPSALTTMSLLSVLLLAVAQGLAELLPVSSSAHVIVAAKLLGLDPTAPDMTLLLVLLHTGTMFAVILYFWSQWRETFFASRAAFRQQAPRLIWATACTGLIGVPLILGIEHAAGIFGLVGRDAHGHLQKAEVELLFGNLALIAAALAMVGTLILIAGLYSRNMTAAAAPLGTRAAGLIGAVQGMCLPFRGFSRSGATISTGLLLGIERRTVEVFSFALAVIITPPVIVREVWRLMHHATQATGTPLSAMILPGLVGMVAAFLAGLVALRWLSGWLEQGRWHYFGIYCLVAAVAVFGLYLAGY